MRESATICVQSRGGFGAQTPTSTPDHCDRLRRSRMAEIHCTEREIGRFWRKVVKTDTCWVWRGHVKHARFRFRGTSDYAHRFSWRLHRGPVPDGLFVLHHCDNPPCVNPDHLFLGTQSDNMRDRDRKGRGRCRAISNDVISGILADKAAGLMIREICNKRGVGKSTVCRYVAGERKARA